MTTVAWKASEKILAADSYATDDGTAIQVRKTAILPNGDVAAGAGTLYSVARALQWLASGAQGDAPDLGDATILFTVYGEMHMASEGWPGVPVKGDCAVGSGAQGALVAMKMGLGAVEAVQAVAGVDPCTGGEIEALTYKPAKARKR